MQSELLQIKTNFTCNCCKVFDVRLFLHHWPCGSKKLWYIRPYLSSNVFGRIGRHRLDNCVIKIRNLDQSSKQNFTKLDAKKWALDRRDESAKAPKYGNEIDLTFCIDREKPKSLGDERTSTVGYTEAQKGTERGFGTVATDEILVGEASSLIT